MRSRSRAVDASAATSLERVLRYVSLLETALHDDERFYAQLVRRGFLHSAIDYARHAAEASDAALRRAIDQTVVAPLLIAKGGGPVGASLAEARSALHHVAT